MRLLLEQEDKGVSNTLDPSTRIRDNMTNFINPTHTQRGSTLTLSFESCAFRCRPGSLALLIETTRVVVRKCWSVNETCYRVLDTFFCRLSRASQQLLSKTFPMYPGLSVPTTVENCPVHMPCDSYQRRGRCHSLDLWVYDQGLPVGYCRLFRSPVRRVLVDGFILE